MSVEAVIFDWGGTLTPWHQFDLREMWQAYAEVVAPDDHTALTAALYEAELSAWSAIKVDQRSATFAGILASAGSDHHAEAIAAYRACWEPHTLTDPAVPEVFASLRARGIRVGVLSNTIWPREWHEEFFARDSVLEFIDGAVYTSEIDYTKPHAEAFQAAMAAVGVDDPARCVFVGDRPYDDISGAAAMGMRAVLVPHSDIPVSQQVPVDIHPDAVIQRLEDLVPHVDGWRGGV